jgi:hemerythrin-like domain-containing protein
MSGADRSTASARSSDESGSAGGATAELRRDHEIILRGLAVLERAGRRMVARQPVDGVAVDDLVALLRRFADQCHHGKEEGYLYPSMKAKSLPREGEIGRLLAAHSEVHDYLGTLTGTASLAERAAAALLYVRVMRQHMETENTTIFPVADRLFDPDEQATLSRAYREMEARSFGPRFRDEVIAELDRIERAVPA